MTLPLSQCAQEVYEHDRNRFYLTLFVPFGRREAFFALIALHIELARVPAMVSEEMIGHIRYAWWQEAVEEIYATGKARGQPVLQALADARLPQSIPMELVNAYRESYPGKPSDADALLDHSLQELVRAVCPEAERRLDKVFRVVDGHRRRFGQRHTHWLAFKLLILII